MSGHSRGPFRADPRERDIVILDADGAEVCRLQEPTRTRVAPNGNKRRANAWLILHAPEFLAATRLLRRITEDVGCGLSATEGEILQAAKRALATYEKETGDG